MTKARIKLNRNLAYRHVSEGIKTLKAMYVIQDLRDTFYYRAALRKFWFGKLGLTDLKRG